jgi:hypothetical protein
MENTMDVLGLKQRYGLVGSFAGDASWFEKVRCFLSGMSKTGNVSQRNDMPLNYNLQIDIFDVWGIDFMGLSLIQMDMSIN